MRSTRAKRLRHIKFVGIVISLSVPFTSVPGLCATSWSDLRREARATLNHLYFACPAARRMGESASAVLVFPRVVKTLSAGVQQGYGTLFAHDRAIGLYKPVAASYSVPKGVQEFGYVLFFMSADDLAELRKSGELEIGRGPELVLGQKTHKQKQRRASRSANASADQVITIAPSATKIVAHASQITYRDAMNDQQEPAPRPNGSTLDPTYRGFIPIPNTAFTRTPAAETQRDGVYGFAFFHKGLIDGLRFQGIKITAIHPD